MPRGLRNLPPGSVVHCVNRANDKRTLFQRACDYEDFLQMVVWAKAQCAVRILAYCVMCNHWHFVFWVEHRGDVSWFLHRLTMTHAKSWRRRTRTIGHGHVYGHRFHDSKIFTERQYYNVMRYVEQNPLRAELVRASCEWRWSSLRERLESPRGLIEEGPAPLPLEWPALVDEHLPKSELLEIRNALKRY